MLKILLLYDAPFLAYSIDATSWRHLAPWLNMYFECLIYEKPNAENYIALGRAVSNIQHRRHLLAPPGAIAKYVF